MLKTFDFYTLRARVYPALIALVPLFAQVVTYFPELPTNVMGKALFTIAGSTGLLYLLATMSRSAGKKTEKRLLRKWGGWPTTIWLRHRDANVLPGTKQRYHRYLQAHIHNASIPTEEQEHRDPDAADQEYASAVQWLKEQRRGDEYSLINKENTEYGFRRNMRGLKGIAIAISLLGVLASAFRVGIEVASRAVEEPVILSESWLPLVAGLFGVIAFLTWAIKVNDEWVREAGDQYARALLASCDV